jgi:hypothetical protein
MGCVLLLDGVSEILVVGTFVQGGVFSFREIPGKILATLIPSIRDHLASRDWTLEDVNAFLICEGPGNLMGLRVCKMVVDTFQVLHPQRPVFTYNRLELMAQSRLEEDPGSSFRLIFPLSSLGTAVLEVKDGQMGQPQWIKNFEPREGDLPPSAVDWGKSGPYLEQILRTRRPLFSFTPFAPLAMFQKMN